MSDNNAHPGVRSLLAKFETGPSPITSPPSRGRSPVSSDTSGSTRPLSRVRASFVTVDGVVQSNPGSPLRKTSGRSDTSSMFGPQINQEDVEARRQNVISPTPGSLGDSQNGTLAQDAAGAQAEGPVKVAPAPKATGNEESMAPRKENAPVKTQQTSTNVQTSTGSQASPDKAGPTVLTKRPSNIHGTRNNATSKLASTTASTTTKPSTDNTAPKQLSAREVAKERSNAIAHKSSRASLNPGAKTSARTNRGPTPSKELSATSPTNVPGMPGTKSPTKPVRLPASATAPTQASSARLGPGSASSGRTSTTASTLTRKPSSLKSAGTGQTRTSASAAGVRRQSSRPSLPVQTAHERPSSRASDVGSTRPLNEGFLARMMRPTESSRSKTHDKPDAKPVPKNTTVAKAPRLSTAKPATTQPKAKIAASKPQSEKPHVAEVESAQEDDVKPVQPRQESEVNNEAASTVIPQEPIAEEPKSITVEQREPEVPGVPAVAENADEPLKSVEGEVAAPEPTQVVESTESAEKVATETPAETSVETAIKTDADALESNEKTDTEAPVEATRQVVEALADPTVKEDEAVVDHTDDREQATTEPASEQMKEKPTDAAIAAVTEGSTPTIEEKEFPEAEQETSEIPEANLKSEPVAETEKDPQVPEPPAQAVDEEMTEPKEIAVPEPTEISISDETPADKKSETETVDVDVASLTLN